MLGSKYFVSREIAAKLLKCTEDEISDLYLVNLARNGFSASKLLEAHERQDQVFVANALFYADSKKLEKLRGENAVLAYGRQVINRMSAVDSKKYGRWLLEHHMFD